MIPLLDVKNYTENSKIEIELLIVSKLDKSLPTVEIRRTQKAYQGLNEVYTTPVFIKKYDVNHIDKFIPILSKTLKIVQFDCSRWKEDGTFA